MKIFVCNRNSDATDSEKCIKDLLRESGSAIAVLQEKEHSDNWQNQVQQKMEEADFVLFMLGQGTFESDALKWEYAKAKQLNKRIVGLELRTASEESILYCQGFQVFESPRDCVNYIAKTFDDDRKLLFEQYKIMVSSTEKVTEQRLKVSNLFFTITSSILSVSFIIGKTFGFSVVGTIGMLALTSMAFLVSFFWKKLILSYGLLNTGKFKVIDNIEKQLRTKMFDHEWKILKEIGYVSNTQTEVKIIDRFRYFILLVGVVEAGYLSKQIDLWRYIHSIFEVLTH